MSNKQDLVSVTTANKRNREKISRAVFLFLKQREKGAVTYSVGTTLRTLLMHDKKKEKKRAGGTRKYR